jgi:RNA polymerase sigma-B factor
MSSRASDALIVRNLPLARALARRYARTTQPLDDLYQVASLGLVKAAHRWEPERGMQFSSYAVPTILGELRRYFRDLTWDVRPPRELQERCLAVGSAKADLQSSVGREPTVAELAERLGRPAVEVREALQAFEGHSLPPLETALAVGHDDAGYERAEARATLQRMTAILDARAREVLWLRYVDDLSQAEIAARIGLSQVSVSRMLRGALEKLSASAACGCAAQPHAA